MTGNSRSSPTVLAALPWTARLRALGHKGDFDLGSLLTLPLTFLDIVPGPGPNTAKFAVGPDTVGSGASYEEAVGRLMLAHPELWRKK